MTVWSLVIYDSSLFGNKSKVVHSAFRCFIFCLKDEKVTVLRMKFLILFRKKIAVNILFLIFADRRK